MCQQVVSEISTRQCRFVYLQSATTGTQGVFTLMLTSHVLKIWAYTLYRRVISNIDFLWFYSVSPGYKLKHFTTVSVQILTCSPLVAVQPAVESVRCRSCASSSSSCNTIGTSKHRAMRVSFTLWHVTPGN
jgi:hypothetical protein